MVQVRKGQRSTRIGRGEFERRMRERFFDPAFDAADTEIARLVDIAWQAYDAGRKAPVVQKAGPGFADPDYALSVDWVAARSAIQDAEARQRDPASTPRVLLIAGAARNEHTCPGEESKTHRLATLARETVEGTNTECDFLDLSVLTAEYGRVIYPCKGCVSTAMPLCHWPCSCYPNHALGQVGDWMNELYPRFVSAHGILLITPVYWYQAPSVLKLLMDRLVCADGGNPDPTATQGKDPQRAKQIELDGWDYPRHLSGRCFAVVVHGDTEGAETLEHTLSSWLTDMGLHAAGRASRVDRYIGYYQPYATSHEALDRDVAIQEETRNAALSLVRAIRMRRAGYLEPDQALVEPRPK